MSSPADRGSASIWVITGAAIVLLIASAVVLRTTATLARHRADAAADLTALAAAGQIGVSADPCSAAAPLARANGAQLDTCTSTLSPDGRSGEVRVEVSVRVAIGPVDGDARASARAGRDDP